MKPPVRLGIIGMGGFAGWHHQTVDRLEKQGEAKLVCTCDPAWQHFADERRGWRLDARGVQIFEDYRAMLDRCHAQLDLLVIPTPIYLHAAMHQAAAELGLPVYLEKPPTLDYLELEDMIRRDRPQRRATLVAFNFIVEKPRQALKQRILRGEFGAVTGATLMAHWPRPLEYFRRNNWAGHLLVDDRIVLDSCLGNANAHFVHNMLFWLGGPDLFSWAGIVALRAELYRAHAIEGADTFFVEADTTAGATLRIADTHACAGRTSHCETIVCEKAVLHYYVGQSAEIHWLDGRVERITLGAFDGLMENHLAYYRYLRGENPRPATTLTDSRPFVALNDLAYVSGGTITPFPAKLVDTIRDQKEQKDYLNVDGMQPAITRFLAQGVWPGPNGWGRHTGAVVTTQDLNRFHPTVRAMAAAAPR